MLRLRSLVPFTLLAGVLLPGSALAGPIGSTELLDRPSGGVLPPDGINESFLQTRESLSGDGNLVVFESRSDALNAPGTDNSQRYVYVRSRSAHSTTNVCRASGEQGELGNKGCGSISISPNGRYVVFRSNSTNLVAGVTVSDQLYRRDLTTTTTTLVSRKTGAAGDAAAGGVWDGGWVADDGTTVFSTYAALDPADVGPAHPDVYARVGATTVLLSRIGGGAVGDAASEDAAISANGATVAFRSRATNFSGLDQNGTGDIYLTTVTGANTPILQSKRPATGAAGNGESSEPSLSQNGSAVAFTTNATDLFTSPITTDTNNHSDVVLRSIAANSNQVASITPGGVQADGYSYWPMIAGDGASVAFASSAPNLGAPNLAWTPSVAVLRRPSANTTTIVSREDGPTGDVTVGFPGGVSTTGDVVAFGFSGAGGTLPTQIATRSVATGSTEPVSTPNGVGTVALGVSYTNVSYLHASSNDGRYVVFESMTAGLTEGADGAHEHVYLRDLNQRTTRLLDRAPGGTISNGDAEEAIISDDGSTVAFYSDANNLVPGVPAGDGHLYVLTLATGALVIGDRASDGTLAGHTGEGGLALSADGRVMAFSTSTKLDPADANTDQDVYVRDLTTGVTRLASRRDGPGGAAADGYSYVGALSADGRRVGFTASDANLVSGDGNGKSDAFIRDLATDSTLLVSRADGVDGVPGNDHAWIVDLSADGTKATFDSAATNLGDGATTPLGNVHLRDLGTGRTSWITAPTSGQQPDGDSAGGSLSADGNRVGFTTDATNMSGADANGAVSDGFVRDVALRQNMRVGVATGTDGAPADQAIDRVVLAGNGKCAVFTTNASNLVPGGYQSPDYNHAYLRAFDGNCPGQLSQPGPVVVPSGDHLAPKLTGLRLSRKAFSTNGKKKGTTLTLNLSEAASLKVAVAKVSAGKKKAGKCVAPRKAKKKAKKCERLGAARALRTVKAAVGKTTMKFDGKLGKKKLAKGTYRFVLTATDAAGNVGHASVLFTVR